VRVAPRVVLSPEERSVLEQWAHRRTDRNFRATRARLLLRAAEGRQDLEIARELGIGRAAVARWRRRFLTARLRGIGQPVAPGLRLARIGDERLRAIAQASTGRDPANNRPWTLRALAQHMGVSHTTVRRIWEARHLRPERFSLWPVRPDPRVRFAPTDVVAVYLHPPDRAIVFALGPDSASAAPGTPTGELRTVPSSDFTELLDRPDLGIRGPSRARSRDFLLFLGAVGSRVGPEQELRVVATLPGVPRSSDLERWRSAHPGIAFEFAPDAPSWRARVLPHLRAVGSRSPLPRNFGARGELARAIRLFLSSYREESGPFEWVASRDEVRSNAAGYRLRYELSVTGHTGFKSPPNFGSSMRAADAPDPRIREMARLLLRKSLGVRKGEEVTVQTWSETLPYANALVLESLRLGARPLLLFQDEPAYWAAAAEVPAGNLARPGEHVRAALRQSDVFVSFFGPSDRERFHSLHTSTRNRLCEYQDLVYDAAERAGARTVQIALGRASEASARMYAVDLDAWRNEMIDAMLVDPDKLRARARRIAEPFRTGKEIRIRHPNGTDLRLGLRGRRALISDGRVPRKVDPERWDVVQLPAGVVTVALDEHTADGVFHSNVVNSIGIMDTIGEVAGGRWTFEKGRLRRYSYEQGLEHFTQSYQRAPPGRDRPGTLSVGLNDRIAISPLLMDQGLGMITLQIGRNDTAGGATRSFWWAWLLLGGADLAVDGKWLLRGGKLVA
jgi:leucyl aminopeptidase (aminopeptidase T)